MMMMDGEGGNSGNGKWKLHRRKGGAGDLFPEGWQIIVCCGGGGGKYPFSLPFHPFIHPSPFFPSKHPAHTQPDLGSILRLGNWPRASRGTGCDQVDISFQRNFSCSSRGQYKIWKILPRLPGLEL